jgi:hypothetical protein
MLSFADTSLRGETDSGCRVPSSLAGSSGEFDEFSELPRFKKNYFDSFGRERREPKQRYR